MDSRSYPARRAPPRGFTTVELIVVVAIIGLLAAIVIPAATGILRRQRLTAVAREVEMVLQRARRRRGVTFIDWQPSPVRRHPAGFSLPELLVALVILAALALMVIPATQKLFRRIRTESTVSGIQRTLNQARLQAIKGGTQVVVQAEQGPAGSPIQLTSFVDANGNFSLDSGERVLAIYSSGWSRMVYWKHGGTAGDLNTAVPFDTYTPAGGAQNTSLKHLIAFLGTGGIAVPAAANSVVPTTTAGRGIYVADDSGLNYFRVTIYSDLISRPVVEKYDAGSSTYMKAGGSQWQ